MELVLELDPGLLMDNRKGADVEELLRETSPKRRRRTFSGSTPTDTFDGPVPGGSQDGRAQLGLGGRTLIPPLSRYSTSAGPRKVTRPGTLARQVAISTSMVSHSRIPC
jgi:hypothetical protein